MSYFQDILQECRSSLSEVLDGEDLDSDEIMDRIHEHADSCVPVYYSDIAQCLADDPELAFSDDYDGDVNEDGVYGVVQFAFYERLCSACYAELEELREARECDDS